jgi:hypothetical protein
MSAEIIIAEWKKNEREILCVRPDSIKDRPIVDCSEWYRAGDSTYKPGRAGLTVSIRHFPSLAKALARAVETANAAGLMGANDS